MSINNGTMNRIGAGGTLNTFGSVQSVDNTKIQELTEAIDSATEAIQEGAQAIETAASTGVQTINSTVTTATDTLNNTVQEAVQNVSDEVDNAKQEISDAATTVVQYDVPVICPKEDVGCVLIKNAELGDTETIEVLRPNGEVVRYTGKTIDFSQLANKDSSNTFQKNNVFKGTIVNKSNVELSPSERTWGNSYTYYADNNGNRVARIQPMFMPNGSVDLHIKTENGKVYVNDQDVVERKSIYGEEEWNPDTDYAPLGNPDNYPSYCIANNRVYEALRANKNAKPALNGGTTWKWLSLSKLNSKIPFEFAIDSDGNYGYKKVGADTVTPFKSGGGANWVTHLLDTNNGVYKQGNYVYCMKLIFPNDNYFSGYPYRSIGTMFRNGTKTYYCYNPVSYSDYTEGDVTWISDPKYIDLYFPGLAGLPRIYHTWWTGIDTQSTKSMLAVLAKGSSVEGGGYSFGTGGLYGNGSTFKMKVEDAVLSSTEVTIPANSSINVAVPSLKNIWVYASSDSQAAGLINIREGSFVVNALRTCTSTYANTAVTVVTCTAMTPTSITLTNTKSAAIDATVIYQTD